MAYDPQDIFNMISQDMILSNTTAEEQSDFISEQIKDPFDSGSMNYFKKLRGMVSADQLDEMCVTLLAEIEDQYPNLEFDLSEYDQHLEEFFNAVYKFFIVNIQKLMYIFIREYIYSRKNQKVLVAEYLNLKLPNYPKEQYGKKEYYILITKLNSIIDDIKDYDLKLKKFIDYIERSGKTPMYVKKVKEYLDQGLIHDKGVVDDFFHKFKRSDEYDQALCKLQMAITENIINPYLEENGVMELRLPPIDPMDDDPSDEEDDSDDMDTSVSTEK